MGLSLLQTEFLYTYAEFVCWIKRQTDVAGFEIRVTETEGCMLLERVGQAEMRSDPGHFSAAKTRFLDRVHMPESLHYSGLARDLNVFVFEPDDSVEGGRWHLLTGDHPVWRVLGRKWMSMHPLASWGGNWDNDDQLAEPGEDDFNHFSFTHGGRK